MDSTWLAINWDLIPCPTSFVVAKLLVGSELQGFVCLKSMSDASGLLSHSAHGSFIPLPAIRVDVYEYVVFQRLFACMSKHLPACQCLFVLIGRSSQRVRLPRQPPVSVADIEIDFPDASSLSLRPSSYPSPCTVIEVELPTVPSVFS